MTAQYLVTTGSTALVAATAKTAIELATTANAGADLISLDVSFNGVSASAVPVVVEIMSYSASGTGTAFTARRMGQAQGAASVVVEINNTVEPATPTIFHSWFVPPTSGLSYQWPLGREFHLPVSSFYGIRLTAPAVVNYIVTLAFEE